MPRLSTSRPVASSSAIAQPRAAPRRRRPAARRGAGSRPGRIRRGTCSCRRSRAHVLLCRVLSTGGSLAARRTGPEETDKRRTKFFAMLAGCGDGEPAGGARWLRGVARAGSGVQRVPARARGFRVALDLGYGTLSRLLALLGSTTAAGLDAVVVTHDHPDHVVDLHGLFRARLYDGQQLPRISLYAPEAVLERIAGLEDSDRSVTDASSPGSRFPRGVRRRPLPAGELAPAPLRAERRRAAVGAGAHRRLHRRHRSRSGVGRARAGRRPLHRRRHRPLPAAGTRPAPSRRWT